MTASVSSPTDAFRSWTTSGQSAGMEHRHGFMWQAVLREAEFGAASRILDLGCGEGWASRLAADGAREGAVVGLDSSPAMINVAAVKNAAARRLLFVHGRADGLPFPQATFSHVISIEALYYMSDLERVATEVHRVLEPDGRFVCAINYYADNRFTQRWSEEIAIPIYDRSAEEHRRAFEAAGFVRTRAGRVHDPAPLPTRYEGRWFASLDDRIAYQQQGALLFIADK